MVEPIFPTYGNLVGATQGIARGDSGTSLHHRVRPALQAALRIGNAYVGRGEESPSGGFSRRKPVREGL